MGRGEIEHLLETLSNGLSLAEVEEVLPDGEVAHSPRCRRASSLWCASRIVSWPRDSRALLIRGRGLSLSARACAWTVGQRRLVLPGLPRYEGEVPSASRRRRYRVVLVGLAPQHRRFLDRRSPRLRIALLRCVGR